MVMRSGYSDDEGIITPEKVRHMGKHSVSSHRIEKMKEQVNEFLMNNMGSLNAGEEVSFVPKNSLFGRYWTTNEMAVMVDLYRARGWKVRNGWTCHYFTMRRILEFSMEAE